MSRKAEQDLIKEFGKEMQGKLDVHSKKGRMGWKDKDVPDLWDELYDEVLELQEALRIGRKRAIQKECADVANICMFIYDKTKQKK